MTSLGSEMTPFRWIDNFFNYGLYFIPRTHISPQQHLNNHLVTNIHLINSYQCKHFFKFTRNFPRSKMQYLSQSINFSKNFFLLQALIKVKKSHKILTLSFMRNKIKSKINEDIIDRFLRYTKHNCNGTSRTYEFIFFDLREKKKRKQKRNDNRLFFQTKMLGTTQI